MLQRVLPKGQVEIGEVGWQVCAKSKGVDGLSPIYEIAHIKAENVLLHRRRFYAFETEEAGFHVWAKKGDAIKYYKHLRTLRPFQYIGVPPNRRYVIRKVYPSNVHSAGRSYDYGFVGDVWVVRNIYIPSLKSLKGKNEPRARASKKDRRLAACAE